VRHHLRIKPTFTITLDLSSKSTLEAIQDFFGGICRIDKNRRRHSVEFVVTSIPQLSQKIVPHFLEYPLYGEKKESFSIFMQVVQAIWEKKHYENQELVRLVKISFAMNRSTQRSQNQLDSLLQEISLSPLKVLEPVRSCRTGAIETEKVTLFERIGAQSFAPCNASPWSMQDPFLAGLIDGDGCFSVSFLANKRILLGFHITGACSKSQFRLFLRVKRRFHQCGSITRKRGTSGSYCRYQVDSFRDIIKPSALSWISKPYIPRRLSIMPNFER